ncbi:MAG: glycosyltransferase family 2 protein [Flavobacterium sp.]|nr:glycosyltransferase family 2 protein [Flavobacterium sp.]
MNYYNCHYIVFCSNEEKFIDFNPQIIGRTNCFTKKVVIVNDNSTDKTEEIINDYAKKYSWITVVNTTSDAIHLPGSKVIQAFHKGFEILDTNYDIMVKLDADLILPNNYFETIISHFKSDDTIGMAGGFAYIEKNGNWILENLTDKDHIRGAFKAYRKECFLQIGNLKPAMGWDTVDELLCKFYGWKVITDENLKVKHLKPTGANYDKNARYKQGEAFYTLGYGFIITAIASVKLALMKKKPLLFFDYIKGFWKAKMAKTPLLVTNEQAKFIRKYRLQKMKEKLF